MSEEAYMSLLVEQPGMVQMVNGIRICVRSVRCRIMPLACLADVAVKDHFVIHRDGDPVAHDTDLFCAPFSKWFVFYPFCRYYACLLYTSPSPRDM